MTARTESIVREYPLQYGLLMDSCKGPLPRGMVEIKWYHVDLIPVFIQRRVFFVR